MKHTDDLIAWFESEYVGSSATAIVAVMENNPLLTASLFHRYKPRPPHDVWDFSLCAHLLRVVPEYRARLDEMREVSPTWSALVDIWSKLEVLLYDGKNAEVNACIRHIMFIHGGK